LSWQQTTAGTQATALAKATTVTLTAAEMAESVLTPTPREFSRKFAKNSSEWRKFMKKYRTKKMGERPFFIPLNLV
jgi:hypothetical protein